MERLNDEFSKWNQASLGSKFAWKDTLTEGESTKIYFWIKIFPGFYGNRNMAVSGRRCSFCDLDIAGWRRIWILAWNSVFWQRTAIIECNLMYLIQLMGMNKKIFSIPALWVICERKSKNSCKKQYEKPFVHWQRKSSRKSSIYKYFTSHNLKVRVIVPDHLNLT